MNLTHSKRDAQQFHLHYNYRESQHSSQCRHTMLVALLLVAHAAAEWVEISQQHYHYTKKPARPTPTNTYLKDVLYTTRNPYQDKEPTRNIQLNLDASHTRKNYKDQDDLRNTYRYHGVSMKDFFPDDDIPLQNPKRNNFEDVEPVRVNPFLQENSDMDTTRHTYIYQDSSQRNAYQNVLQKPMRDDFLNQDVPFKEPSRETFLNHSITEHKWIQNLYRQNNVRGNENTHPTNERRKHEDNIPDTTSGKDETTSGKIERVPNVGSIKRVQLENTPVKSPALNKKIPEKITVIKSSNRRNDENGTPNDDNFSDDLDIVTDNFNSFEAGVSMRPSNMFKHVISSFEQHHTQIDGKNKVRKTPAFNFHNHTFTAKPDSDIDEAIQSKGNVMNQQKNVLDVVESSVNRPKPQTQFTSNENLPDFPFKNKKIIETKEEIKINDAKTNKNQSPHGSTKFQQKENGDKENSSQGEKINTSGEVKVSTMENILKFMKIVAETIAKNTRRGTSGKITYLNELKHTLLDNIKERIDGTWPDDTSATTRRHSRAASSRGHVEFPSSESCLMTISFLTFAVFLIKLVLQVIQAYKHKSMLMAPLMVATAGRSVAQNLRAS